MPLLSVDSPLPDASLTLRGVVSTGSQSFGGIKTFQEVVVSNQINASGFYAGAIGQTWIGLGLANDGPSAVGLTLNNNNALTEGTGAVLLRIQNGGSTVATVSPGGTFTSSITSGSNAFVTTGGILRLHGPAGLDNIYSTAGWLQVSARRNNLLVLDVGTGGTVAPLSHEVSNLGSSGLRWANIHSVLGTFSSGISASTGTFGTTASITGSSTLGVSLQGAAADGASAVGLSFNNTTTLANATAKLFSVQNNGSEKLFSSANDGQIATGSIYLGKFVSDLHSLSGSISYNTGDATFGLRNANGAVFLGVNLGTGLASSTGSFTSGGTVAGTDLKATNNNSDYVLTTGTPHVNLLNNSGGQTLLVFRHGGGAGTVLGGVRSDSAGNFNWHSSGTQGHVFYLSTGIDQGMMTIRSSGVMVGGATTCEETLHVVGNAVTYGIVRPGTTNAYALGSATKEWSNVYSVLGTYSGTVFSSASVGLAISTGNYISLSGTGNTGMNLRASGSSDLIVGMGGTNAFQFNAYPSDPSLRNFIAAQTSTDLGSASFPWDVSFINRGVFNNTGATNAIELSTNGVIHFNGTGQSGCYIQSSGTGTLGFGVSGSAIALFDSNGLNVNQIYSRTATTVGLISTMADGASAVAFSSDTSTTWSNSTSKLHSYRNNGSEKAYVGYDGSGVFSGGLTFSANLASSATTSALYLSSSRTAASTTAAAASIEIGTGVTLDSGDLLVGFLHGGSYVSTIDRDGKLLSNSATFTGPNTYKGATGITAFAGGGQASATQLTAEINFVTVVATNGDSVKLPSVSLGQRVVVFNDDAAQSLDIFPASGDQIDALGVDTAYSLAAGASREFFGKNTDDWRSK